MLPDMGLLERYDALLARVLAEVRHHYGASLVAVAVFGSVGRRTPRADSDVDLLLVVRGLPDGRSARVAQFLPLEARLETDLRAVSPDAAPTTISPVFKTPEEVTEGSPLFLDLVEDARILYDPEGFLAEYLGRLGARLRELGARRIWLGNAWYWDLKPDLKPGETFSL